MSSNAVPALLFKPVFNSYVVPALLPSDYKASTLSLKREDQQQLRDGVAVDEGSWQPGSIALGSTDQIAAYAGLARKA